MNAADEQYVNDSVVIASRATDKRRGNPAKKKLKEKHLCDLTLKRRRANDIQSTFRGN